MKGIKQIIAKWLYNAAVRFNPYLEPIPIRKQDFRHSTEQKLKVFQVQGMYTVSDCIVGGLGENQIQEMTKSDLKRRVINDLVESDVFTVRLCKVDDERRILTLGCQAAPLIDKWHEGLER